MNYRVYAPQSIASMSPTKKMPAKKENTAKTTPALRLLCPPKTHWSAAESAIGTAI